MRKLSRYVVAGALVLTLLPGLARSAEMPHSNLIVIMFDLAKPKKPQFKKPCVSPCCPMGVCTGARTMSCCPVAHACTKTASCPMQGPCGACKTTPKPTPKPMGCAKACCDEPCCEKACCDKPCCVQAQCCKVEPTLAELRALCAEQARVLREMHVMMKEMRDTIDVLKGELQLQRQNQVNSLVPSTGPTPYGSQAVPYNVMPIFPEGSFNNKAQDMNDRSELFSFVHGLSR